MDLSDERDTGTAVSGISVVKTASGCFQKSLHLRDCHYNLSFHSVMLILLCGCICRSVCTLADLEEYICQQFSTDNKKIESFNELGMGPLLKFDLVKANFRPPAHLVEVPQVCVLAVLQQS